MAIIITTRQRDELLTQLTSMMDGVTIPTWVIDSDGDFTMTHRVWALHAWFRPNLDTPDRLVLNIVSSRNHRMTRELYGVYHGRMTATLLAYFDHMIDTVTSTAMPGHGDIISCQ